MVIYCDAERQEDALRKRRAGGDDQRLALAAVVGHAHKDVPLVIRTGVIAVDDADGIIQLEAIFEAQTAARIDCQHPAFFDQHPKPRRNFDAFARAEFKTDRCKEVIPSGTACRALRHADALICGDGLFNGLLRKRRDPIRDKAAKGNLFKTCDTNHKKTPFVSVNFLPTGRFLRWRASF